MKISDRDKKIIVIVLIAMVIGLPYLFIIRPFGEKQDTVEAEIVTLQERYDYLNELNQQRAFYLGEIDRLTKERGTIIAEYAEGIRQENIIMFLRGLEFELPMAMKTISFSGNAVTPISAGVADAEGNVTDAIDAVASHTSVAYSCKYEEMKTFLNYIFGYEDKMTVSSVDMTYDSATGQISGMFVLDQYAMVQEGSELDAAVIPSMEHGVESIFGTYISDEELLEQMGAGDEGDAEDEEE